MHEVYRNQVRLLLSVLPLVAQEKGFALKGGTAINLFDRDFPRLSVDIDLTYLFFDDRAMALANIAATLARLKGKIEGAISGITVTLVAQGDGTEAKLHCQHQGAQVKIEVNTTMRGHLFAPRPMACSEKVQEEFGVFVEATVVSQGELYGGKICAALDRQHPRDLFDVHRLLNSEGMTDEIKQGFVAGLLSHPRPIQEVLFPKLRDQKQTFDAQFAGMAFTPFTYDDLQATRLHLNEVIKGALTNDDRAFLLTFKDGLPDWSLQAAPDLAKLPAVQWKLAHIRKLKQSNPSKHAAMRNALAARLRG